MNKTSFIIATIYFSIKQLLTFYIRDTIERNHITKLDMSLNMGKEKLNLCTMFLKELHILQNHDN